MASNSGSVRVRVSSLRDYGVTGHQRTHPRAHIHHIHHLFRRSAAYANQNAMGGCGLGWALTDLQLGHCPSIFSKSLPVLPGIFCL